MESSIERKKRPILIAWGRGLCLLIPCSLSEVNASITDIDELFELSLEKLTQLRVSTPSKFEEAIADAPSVVSVITARDIRQFGANNLQDILRRMPGLAPETSVLLPDNLVSIRGQQSSIIDRRTLLLLNGHPIRDTNSGGSNATVYNSFPVNAIERIEVIRGPGSVLYGSNAFSGVINLITKNADSAKTQLSLGSGSYNTYRGEGIFQESSKGKSILLAGQWENTHGWEFKATDITDVYDELDMEEQSRGNLVQVSINDFSFTAFQGQLKQDFLGANQRWPADLYDRNTHFIDLGYELALESSWISQFNIIYNRNNRSTESGAIDLDSYNVSYEAAFRGNISKNINALFGFSYIAFKGEDKNAAGDSKNFEDTWKSVYTQFKFDLAGSLYLTAGAQYNDTGIETDTSYRGELVWPFFKSWGTKLLYGEAYRSPYMSELSIDTLFLLGNSNLVPERIKTIDIQIYYNSENYRFEFTVFDSHFDDEINLIPKAGGGFTFVNSGEMDFEGVEIEGRAQLTNQLYVKGSYSYQKNETETGQKNTQIVPNTMVKLGISYTFENDIQLGLFNTYYGDPADWSKISSLTQERNPNDKSFNFVTLNIDAPLSVFIRHPTAKKIQLSLFGDNLLESDIVYEPDISRPNNNAWPKYAERAFYFKVKYIF